MARGLAAAGGGIAVVCAGVLWSWQEQSRGVEAPEAGPGFLQIVFEIKSLFDRNA